VRLNFAHRAQPGHRALQFQKQRRLQEARRLCSARISPISAYIAVASGDGDGDTTAAPEALTRAPHSRQNFADTGSSVPQFEQLITRPAPHSRQDFACAGFSQRHAGHRINGPPADQAGSGDHSWSDMLHESRRMTGHLSTAGHCVRGVVIVTLIFLAAGGFCVLESEHDSDRHAGSVLD
jgi:hypothetical protein